MSPIKSAFSVYQNKRLKRLKKRMRKNKPQSRNFVRRAVPSTSNADVWATDNGSVAISEDSDAQEGMSGKKFKKDALTEPSTSRYNKRDTNYPGQVDWGSNKVGKPSSSLENVGFSPPDTGVKRKNRGGPSTSESQRRPEMINHRRTRMPQARKTPGNDRVNSCQFSDVADASDDAEQVEEIEDNASEENEGDCDKDIVPDSIREGEELFSWLINPLTQTSFFNTAWEMKPMHIRRRKLPDYYKDLISMDSIDTALFKHYLTYSRNVDITHYTNGKRKTLNPVGRATRKDVWDFYNKGYTIRLLNPQTYLQKLGIMLATLQEYFCSYVGANVYLTPPDAQGFAPHYDDIEAFVLQIEGKKHWKVYKPRQGAELPRESSEDFHPQDLDEKPVLDVTINEGELLYFPRGWIHEASTVPGCKSLHITVSCYQHQSWIDLFEKMMPAALHLASEDLEFRRGLPLGYLHVMGVAHSDLNTPGRNAFLADFTYLCKKLLKFFAVDATIDQFGRQFMHDALPPMLGSGEVERSIYASRRVETNDGKMILGKKLTKNMKIRLVKATVLRIASEDQTTNKVQLYHCARNSLVYHESEEHKLEVEIDEALMIEYLLHVYPRYTLIRELPTNKVPVARKVGLATVLYNQGTLLVSK